MMRARARAGLWTLLLLPSLISSTPAAAQACPDPVALTRGVAEPLATVRYLADDALEGRLPGTAGERCAGDYVAARLRSLGLRGGGADGSYFQEVPLASVVNPHAPATGTGRNVLAVLEGSDPALRDEYIVIGAHYDHLGRGAFSSMAPDQAGEIHNGADDNASGVAALLHAARLLAEGERPARSILFMAFTAEESGLLGSAHFTRNPTVPLDRVRSMLNLDMVGRLRDGPVIVYGVETALEWGDIVNQQADRHGLRVAPGAGGDGRSDHASFYTSDIPVLHFFTNTHGDYHRPSDDWELIDGTGLEKIAGLVADISRQVASAGVTMTLQRVAPDPAAAPAGRGSGAWLGTVPDFTPVARGVLLGGVTAGSPGEAAGLRKGDILVGFGGRDVADLEAFTAALREHKPGDAVEIVILRDGVEVRVRATLGRRGG